MANNKIKTTALDFDTIKENLKEYLRGQQKFSDYDFEGSTLSLLLDVLAYNTHYTALYDNLAVNEAFLDSASKRSSVISKAKELGYVPTSSKAATAVVRVVMINNQVSAPQTIEIPPYTKFNTRVNNNDYTFYTQDTHLAYKEGNQYVFDNMTLREGTYLTYSWTANGIDNEFRIPNPGVDVSTLRVVVQEHSQTSNFDTYAHSSTFLNVDGTSQVYFVKEVDDGYHMIEFGNDVVGKALVAGNVVTVDYMVGSEDEPNGARTFTYAGGLLSNTQAFVTTLTPAYGGAASESIVSIKWNAPRAFAAQNRCVTLDDFRSVVSSQFPAAQSINVWGGEQNNPPSYGDVFISVKPYNGETLSDADSDYLLNEIIAPRKMVTVHPKLVDPTFVKVEMNTAFYYNPEETVNASKDIAAAVRTEILNYNDLQLSKFGGILKYSALTRAIDSAENSIKSSITTIKLHCEVEPVYNQSVQYIVDLGNPIYNSGIPENSVVSNGVQVLNYAQTVYFDDVPVENSDHGTIRMFYYLGSTKQFLKNVGTIDYAKGLITLDNIIITGLNEDTFTFVIKPQSNDVVSTRNQIVMIPTEMLTITPVVDKSADQYKFTSSRN
jgi:hypothetical protein